MIFRKALLFGKGVYCIQDSIQPGCLLNSVPPFNIKALQNISQYKY